MSGRFWILFYSIRDKSYYFWTLKGIMLYFFQASYQRNLKTFCFICRALHAVWFITVRDIRVILGPVLKLYLVSDVIVTS